MHNLQISTPILQTKMIEINKQFEQQSKIPSSLTPWTGIAAIFLEIFLKTLDDLNRKKLTEYFSICS